MIKSLIYAILTGLIVTPGFAYADPKSDVNSAINQAEAMRQKADAIGGEWRDTNALIQQARAAMQKSDFNQAQSLTEQASRQAELGYQQALQNKKADFPAYFTLKK